MRRIEQYGARAPDNPRQDVAAKVVGTQPEGTGMGVCIAGEMGARGRERL